MTLGPGRLRLALGAFAALALGASAQVPSPSPSPSPRGGGASAAGVEAAQQELVRAGPGAAGGAPNHQLAQLAKQIDDLMWELKLQDVATIDKIVYTSKPGRDRNPTGQGAGNPMIIPAYVFTPKSLRAGAKAPLLVYVHGGIHSDFTTGTAALGFTSGNIHIVRELMAEGYVVIAPEYRGSTGYGQYHYDQIDYGGAEIDDTYAARNWAVENLPQVDRERVGIIGWSHGGYQALLNVFNWPKAYKAAYAGVPVSDLVQRMGYKNQAYRDMFASFIGKQAVDNPAEYRRRSPVNHVATLETPLLVHTNTTDEDVNVMEVEHLVEALKAAGKKFEYKVYEAAPGGHSFNRLDTPLARESRREVYAFLAKYLK
jgi:dipeptidyl aminopeptidase/acylaminoacyl peptidase